MSTTPYAALTVALNGGAPTTGAIVAVDGDVVHLGAVSTDGWKKGRYEIRGPLTWAVPAGWTNENGVAVYVAVTEPPPQFTISGVYGKWMLTLTVNDGAKYLGKSSDKDGEMVDKTTAIKVLSPSGYDYDMGWGEEGQFDVGRAWQAAYSRLARAMEDMAFPAGARKGPYTAPATGSADTIVFTVPGGEAGALIASSLLVRLKAALVGAGSVTFTIGLTSGGEDFILQQTIDASTPVGTVYGLDPAERGTGFTSGPDGNALLDGGDQIVLTMTKSGTVTTRPVLDVRLLGKLLVG